MRSYYANESSQNAIAGLNTQYLEPAQITSTVDGGGEGGVIYDSAVAFWQGFYPPSTVKFVSPLFRRGSDTKHGDPAHQPPWRMGPLSPHP